MEKEIEDYLHLYIGSEVFVKTHDREFVATLMGVSEDSFNLVGNMQKAFLIKNKFDIIFPYKSNWFRLLLRPLSDLTQDERNIYESIQKDNGGELSISGKAFGTKYLISIGADVFRLIEAGLSIDKTKMPV